MAFDKEFDKDFDLIKQYDKQYCMGVFSLQDVAFTKGKGVYLYDTEGKKYMDMIGGIAVNTLGHGNAELKKAIAKQAGDLIHCCNYYHIASKSELAYRLCSMSFADKVFFCNSGAEANEAAIKLARGYFYYKGQDRYEIITAKMSFHGRTMATIAATGQEKFRKPFEPGIPGFLYAEYNDIDSLRSLVGPHTAAVMLELIQGESGVHPADKAYVQEVRKLCSEQGILLIIDEVQTGIARTGRMFCYENYGITPDIMTLAKGLAGGVPIGAMLATNNAATGFKVGDHGTTFGGNPLATTAAHVVLDQIREKDLLINVNSVCSYIFESLNQMSAKYGGIKQVRGMGLLIGIEFEPLYSAGMVRDTLLSKGYLVSAIGASTIRIAPPLIITQREAASFLKAVEGIIKKDKSIPMKIKAALGSKASENENITEA